MRKLTIYLFLILFLFLFSSLSLAQVPPLINYQGVLKDNSETPLQGNYEMTFRIWPAPQGGTNPLWEETYDENSELVPVDKGLFSVQLGSVNAFDLGLDPPIFNGSTRYLEIIVNGETMSQRIPLISVPYAFRSEQVGGFVADDFVRFGTSTSQETTEKYGLYVRSSLNDGIGVLGETSSTANAADTYGVYGLSSFTGSGAGIGVYGECRGDFGAGVKGKGKFFGIQGISSASDGTAVAGFANSSTGSTVGISGSVNSPDGFAGYFSGGRGVYIKGPTTTAGVRVSGSFNIQTYVNSGTFPGVFFVDTSSSGSTITLPLASDKTHGMVFHIYNISGSNSIALTPTGTNTIIGATGTSKNGGCLRVIGYSTTSSDDWIVNEL